MKVKVLVAQLCPTLQLRGLQPDRLLCPQNSPGKNTGVSCHCFDLPDPGIKPGSLALQADSLLSEPPGKPLSHHNMNQIALKAIFIIIELFGESLPAVLQENQSRSCVQDGLATKRVEARRCIEGQCQDLVGGGEGVKKGKGMSKVNRQVWTLLVQGEPREPEACISRWLFIVLFTDIQQQEKQKPVFMFPTRPRGRQV